MFAIGQAYSLFLLVYGGYLYLCNSGNGPCSRILARLALHDSLGQDETLAEVKALTLLP